MKQFGRINMIKTFLLAVISINISLAASVNSISDSRQLTDLIETIDRDRAAFGHFAANETFRVGVHSGCEQVSSRDVALFLEDRALKTDLDEEIIQEAIGDFETVLGDKIYSKCKLFVSEPYYYTYLTSFVAEDNSYQIQFEEGYED